MVHGLLTGGAAVSAPNIAKRLVAILPGLLLALCLAVLAVPSAQAFKAPAFQGNVLDEAGLLAPGQPELLKERIRVLREQDGIWAAIYVAGSLQGESIEEAAVATFEKWKLGKSGKDNGVLVLVVPSERKMRIEVGYGLEGTLTDALSKRVIDEIYKPAFRDSRFMEGLMEGFEAMARAVRGEKALPDAVADAGGGSQVAVELDGEAFLTRFLGVLGINLAFPLFYAIAKAYGKARGRLLAEPAGLFRDRKMIWIVFGFFGVIFGLFISIFGLAFPDDPEVPIGLACMNALFTSFFVLPCFPLVRGYLSASAYRRRLARERLLRIRRRSRVARRIFGTWFDPEDVPANRGGARREISDSLGSFSSSSGSSSDSSSSSGGGSSGGGGASGSW